MPNASTTAEIVIAADCWQQHDDAEAVVQRAIAAATDAIKLPAGSCEVAIMLTDDVHVRTLNRDWRDKDAPTNVLSFPAAAHHSPDQQTRMLGDIAIAYETVQREAESEGKRFNDHLSHLVVHGFLHLLGYDHLNDDEADEMEDLERDILATLKISDPYALSDQDPT